MSIQRDLTKIKRWLLRDWYVRQRRLDRESLWPKIRQSTPDIYQARARFIAMAFQKPAWQALGNRQILREVDKMQ
jgi:hypothetical protein